MATVKPRPGDWFVVSSASDVGLWVRLGERLIDGRDTRWSHAGVCTGILLDGTVMITEAMPSGAREVPWHYDGMDHLWSSVKFATRPAVAQAARKYIGVSYSFLDYGAIALHAAHLPVSRDFINDSGHMICSQLVDQACQDAGWQLFADGRWDGYVKPSDLGHLLGA